MPSCEAKSKQRHAPSNATATDSFRAHPLPLGQNPFPTAAMQIILTRVTGKEAMRQLTIEVEGEWTVDQLKAFIEEKHGVEAATQLITFNSVKLLTGTKLSDYKIYRDAGLQLAERPVGAGRHAPEQGSLEQEVSHICGAGDGMRGRWRQVGGSKAKLEEQKQALMLTNSGDGELKKKIKLNVGGSMFEVRRKVLCADPESKLAALFSGRWETKTLRDKDGIPYMDGNPECFSAMIGCLKAYLKSPEAPVEVPVVAQEFVPTLHRQLGHFKLGHLFVEGAAAGDMGPEPDDGGEEGVPPAEAGAGGAPAPVVIEEREHRAAENEQIELPARTIDHIISARYGSLDEPGQSIDVTRMLVGVVDEEGALTLTVSSSGFGADPAPEAEKQLSIRYKPREAWDSESFEDRLKRLQAAADSERAALWRAVKKQRECELDFKEELEWVKHYTKAEVQPAGSEVVELAVGFGGQRDRVCVKRSTLMLCEGSSMARKFDPRAAPAPADDGAAAAADADDSDDSSSDDDVDGANTIGEDWSCFRKLIDQLRLIAIATPGDPPPPPIVREHEEAAFAKLLSSYFEGVEDFIKTKGEHRPVGTSVRAFNTQPLAQGISEEALKFDHCGVDVEGRGTDACSSKRGRGNSWQPRWVVSRLTRATPPCSGSRRSWKLHTSTLASSAMRSPRTTAALTQRPSAGLAGRTRCTSRG